MMAWLVGVSLCVLLSMNLSYGQNDGNQTLVVTTILEDPYLMRYADREGFYGYIPDLLEELAEMIGFQYELKLVPDGRYGAPDANDEWSGMIGELLKGRADIAASSLTITYLREQVVDFTKPFMRTGLSAMVAVRTVPKSTTSVSFVFKIFKMSVWCLLLLAFLTVSLCVSLIRRFNPNEHEEMSHGDSSPKGKAKAFHFSGSTWFAFSTLTLQGYESRPKSLAGRLLVAFWFIFVLVVIALYIGTISQNMPFSRETVRQVPFHSIEDIAKQTEYKYGVINGGSSYTFFKTSKIPLYEGMWHFMSETKPSAFVSSTKEGIDRVKRGKYVFFTESTTLEYIAERNCDLTQVGGLLSSTAYGFALPRGSPYKEPLSDAILKLQEDHTLQMLYNKWWKRETICSTEDIEIGTSSKRPHGDPLYVVDERIFGGALIFLCVGVVLAALMTGFEIFLSKFKKHDKKGDAEEGRPIRASAHASEAENASAT